MDTVNQGVKLVDSPAYPTIIPDYTSTFESQQQLTPDVWVSSHAGMFGLHEKYKAGPYDPDRFVDPKGYLDAVKMFKQRFLDQLTRERREALQ